MMEESKKELLDWVDNNGERATAYIQGVLDERNIKINRVEATVGRKQDQWTVRDLAKVMLEMRSVAEGMISAEDIYPEIGAKETGEQSREKSRHLPPEQMEDLQSAVTADHNRVIDGAKEPDKPKSFTSVNPGIDLQSFGISGRALTILTRSGIKTVGQLVQCRARALMKLDGFGYGCLENVANALDRHGLSLLGGTAKQAEDPPAAETGEAAESGAESDTEPAEGQDTGETPKAPETPSVPDDGDLGQEAPAREAEDENQDAEYETSDTEFSFG